MWKVRHLSCQCLLFPELRVTVRKKEHCAQSRYDPEGETKITPWAHEHSTSLEDIVLIQKSLFTLFWIRDP